MSETITLSPRTHDAEQALGVMRGCLDLLNFRARQIAEDLVEFPDEELIVVVLEDAEQLLRDDHVRAAAELIARHGKFAKIGLTMILDAPLSKMTLARINSRILRTVASEPTSLVVMVDCDGVTLTGSSDLLPD